MWDNAENSGVQELPRIVKFVEKSPTGVEAKTLSRCAVGYLVHGVLYLYEGDRRRIVQRGEVVFFSIGRHYIEAIPEESAPFELLIFHYAPRDLQHILTHLHLSYHLTINNTHSCEQCRAGRFVVAEASAALRNFFAGANGYLREQLFRNDEMAEQLKLTELVYLLVAQEEGCLKSRLLASVDRLQGSFEQVVYDHVFEAISIEELAAKTHRSLTSFKKEFRRHFATPPHKWFVAQRLTQARLLLISTSKSIAEIGNECAFPNTSHFIKLFKRAYHATPAAYRAGKGEQ